MKLSLIDTVLLALAAAPWPVSAWKHVSVSAFRQALKDDHTLVAFVDPSLEASQQLDIEWAAVQDDLSGSSTSIVGVVSVDCAAQAALCDEHDVASYPAIRLVDGNGRVHRYRGPRRSPDIVSFVRRALRPVLSRVDDHNITTFVAADDIVFVAALSRTADDDSLRVRFADIARQYADRYGFAVASSAVVSSASSVTCHTPDGTQTRSGRDLAVSPGALDAFIQLCTAPVVVDMTRRNELQLYGGGKSLVHYFYRTEAERRDYSAAVRPLAARYREYLTFTLIDAREYGNDMMPALGLGRPSAGTDRRLAVQNPGNGDVFPYTRPPPISPPAIEQFLAEIIQGAVKPWSPAAAGTGSGHDEL